MELCAVPGAQGHPVVASEGTGYLVAWRDERDSDYDAEIYARRLTDDPDLGLQPEFRVPGRLGPRGVPDVAALNGNYLVVWYREGVDRPGLGVFGALLSAEPLGDISAPFAIHSGPDWVDTALVASDGSQFLVLWHQWAGAGLSGGSFYATRLTAKGVVRDPDPLQVHGPQQLEQIVVLTGQRGGFLAAWEGKAGGITAARVSSEGSVHAVGPVVIRQKTYAQLGPAVAFNGAHYLAVWADDRLPGGALGIYGVRIARNGTLADTSAFAISTNLIGQSRPWVANCGGDFLVVWDDGRSYASTQQDIYGARVADDGTVLDPGGFPICAGPSNQTSPAVASDGREYLVVWTDDRNHGGLSDLYAARVTRQGAVRDPAGFPVVSMARDDIRAPVVASNGSEYLAVWQDGRDSYFQIYGARVSGDGSVKDPQGFALSSASAHQVNPDIGVAGGDYLVVWSDGRLSPPPSIINPLPATDIFGTRVDGTGRVLDPQGLQLCTAPDYQNTPVVAADGGRFLVLWQDWRNRATNGADVYGILVALPGQTDAEAEFEVATGPGDQSPGLVVHGGSSRFLAVGQSIVDGVERARARFLDAARRPVLEATSLPAGLLRLEWTRHPGGSYRVQVASRLEPPDWTDWIGPVEPQGLILNHAVDSIGTASARLYRVVKLP